MSFDYYSDNLVLIINIKNVLVKLDYLIYIRTFAAKTKRVCSDPV